MAQEKKEEEQETKNNKQPWQSMLLTFVGNLSEIVKGGGGKLSLTGGDTGDSRKPAGHG